MHREHELPLMLLGVLAIAVKTESHIAAYVCIGVIAALYIVPIITTLLDSFDGRDE